MPTLSTFFGIIISMYREVGAKHKTPHFHAEYQNDEVVIDFDGNVLEGSIPGKKLKLVLAWVEIHQEDLRANWKLLEAGREHFKIDPLR